MTSFVTPLVGLIAFGSYLFVVYYFWFKHLVSLADTYDLPTRKKRAGNRSILVALALLPSFPLSFLAIADLLHTHPLFALFAWVVSLVPALAWWFRRSPQMRSMGYWPDKGVA
jgi:Flp pilus assembly protein TadB